MTSPSDAMRFTDDDLKQYKQWLDQYPPAMRRLPMIDRDRALIARLEASEQANNTMLYVKDQWIKLPFGATLENELERWREVSGR